MRASEDVRAALDRAGRFLSSLETRIAALEESGAELEARLAAAEGSASRLLGLYAATYQLHSTLDPEEVLATLGEITLNLLGADSYGVILRDEHGATEVALVEAPPRGFSARVSGPAYLGGDALLDACLADGVLRVSDDPGAETLAAVPLTLQGQVIGVLAVWRLLQHREPLGEPDRELCELLSVHAATALCAARLHAGKERKLRTLEGVVALLRRGSGSGSGLR